jgi:hypothetical protein
LNLISLCLFIWKVYGALNVTRQGSFAQYCAAGEDEVKIENKEMIQSIVGF